jgi:hypothetical protein
MAKVGAGWMGIIAGSAATALLGVHQACQTRADDQSGCLTVNTTLGDSVDRPWPILAMAARTAGLISLAEVEPTARQVGYIASSPERTWTRQTGVVGEQARPFGSGQVVHVHEQDVDKNVSVKVLSNSEVIQIPMGHPTNRPYCGR